LREPTLKLFTGQDLDDAQKVTAALVLYIIRMGVDPRVVVEASGAGPDEMLWLSLDQARDLRVIYQPWAYKPWRIEPYRNGAIAITESVDGLKQIVAACSNRLGPYVAVIDANTSWDVAEWLNQCRSELKTHPVFGTQVDSNRMQVIRRKEGGAIMRFQLPTINPPLSSPELLNGRLTGYSRACSTNEYQGSSDNFVSAVRLALHNCYQD
jgi:hypothetical protein